MTRMEFFQQLNEHMAGLPDVEQKKLADYYAEYFHEMVESGMTEDEVSASLETPAVIVERLRADLGLGRQSKQQRAHRADDNADASSRDQSQNNGDSSADNKETYKQVAARLFGRPSLLTIALLVISAPLWLSAFFGLLGGLLGLIAGLIGALVAFAVSAVTLVVTGVVQLFSQPLNGVLLIGVGLLLAGLFFYCIALLKLLFGPCMRAIKHSIAWCKQVILGIPKGGPNV